MENTAIITYPTTPSAEGFYFDSETDAELAIVTKKYDTGSIVKQTTLPQSKKVAVTRNLKAKDMAEVNRLMGKDPESYMMAVVTIATTFDGKKMVIEDIAELPMKDFQRLVVMCSALNF